MLNLLSNFLKNLVKRQSFDNYHIINMIFEEEKGFSIGFSTKEKKENEIQFRLTVPYTLGYAGIETMDGYCLTEEDLSFLQFLFKEFSSMNLIDELDDIVFLLNPKERYNWRDNNIEE